MVFVDSLVPAIPEEADKDIQKAQALMDFLALFDEEGPTCNEIVKQLKGFTRYTEFIYLLILGKAHLLPDNVYPFPEYIENGTVLRMKLVQDPVFKELEPGMYDRLMADPSASFEYNDAKKRLELSILAHACRYITDTGFYGSIRYMSKNYALQDLFYPFQYKEIFDARPRTDLCTAIKLYEEEEYIPNALIEQIKSSEGRQHFKAILAASTQSTISEKIKLMDSLDKVDDSKIDSGGGTKIQINVMGSNDKITTEVKRVESD